MVLAAEVLLGALILVLVGALATGRSGGLEDEGIDAPPFLLPAGPLRAAELSSIRLPMAVRGYRMAEVDALLDRIGSQLEGGVQAAGDDPEGADQRYRAAGLRPGSSAPGVGRQLLGLSMGATAATAVVWALAAAGKVPMLLAVLVALAALLLLPLLWPVYGGASRASRHDVGPAVDVPADRRREGSEHG